MGAQHGTHPGTGPAAPPSGAYAAAPFPGPPQAHGGGGGFGPATPPAYPGTTAPGPRRRGRKPYYIAAAAVAVCAVVVGAVLLTRPGPPAGPADALPVADSSPAPARPSGGGDTRDGEVAALPEGGDASADPAPSPAASSAGPDAQEPAPSASRDAAAPAAPAAPDPAPAVTVTATRTATARTSGGATSAPPASPTPAWITDCTFYSGTGETKYGDKGARVTQVQCMLSKRGYSVGSAGVDGDFGAGTRNAVLAFQRAARLSVDGIVGPQTWAALRSTS
ncbi:peptidoglycan-binding protein [Streptomyces sp. CC228A]|uniref:peptidoglycan-binding domain-containing protein n=1 Tax=Streptomyces sp. CC228A TaxID=2898186 RepID=UPI0022A82146|nr:peptidoglycan-binding protein [Streptomyces sp. CC228A]